MIFIKTPKEKGINKILNYYNRPFYSSSQNNYRKVGWLSKEDQNNRFKCLLNIGVKENDYILDYGCGLGDLLNYINDNNLNINYLGVDINPDFIEKNKNKYGEEYFKLINNYNNIKEKFDWFIASGTFTVYTSNIDLFYTIKYFYNKVNKGLSFNLLRTPFYENEKTNISKNEPVRGYSLNDISNYFNKNYKNVKITLFKNNEFNVYIYK